MVLPMRSFTMRIISFPDAALRKYKLEGIYLASQGYFWKDGSIRCIHEAEVALDPLTFQDTAHTRLPQHVCSKSNLAYMIDDMNPLWGRKFQNYESHRILSFMDGCNPWPRSLDKYAMAASGFYYTGVGDRCHCAFCPLSVSDWELHDTPEGEHRRWYPTCPFLNGNPVGNVPLSVESAGLEGHYNMPKLKRVNVSSPAYQNMCKFYSRNETFVNWQYGGNLTALSKAGFFNDADQLVCFYCAGTIKNPRSVKDPWISHAAWFPSCEYLLQEKTYQFVESIQSLVIKL
jgi:Inhibitor of Apoptosis domain